MLAEAETVWSVAAKAVPIVGTVLLAWIALQQARLAKKVGEVATNTNSMRETMVDKAEKEGHQKGVAEQKEKTVMVDSIKEVLVAVTAAKPNMAPLHEMPAIKSLVNIEGHTAGIEKNTSRAEESASRTEAAVEEMKDKAAPKAGGAKDAKDAKP